MFGPSLRALDDHGAVVLLAAVEAIRIRVVDDDVVELRRRLVVLRAPALPAVDGDGHAAVVRVRHVARVLRVDPELVVVAVRGRQRRERAPAVDRLHDRRVHDVHDVRVRRIGGDVHVVPRARLDVAVLAQEPPRLPGVIRAIEPALFRLDDREHAVGVRGRYRDADLAHELRQPFRETRPACRRHRSLFQMPLPGPPLRTCHGSR